ncbi:hypothetical protein [Hymenobacter fodinae]|uniref:hypothetical protein n=1 Tax=Hymenobacter fodinae TaxID=2510796 RepID=UPI001081665E|nr:hypothetical protein [Hymenobacter fodinae]
MKTLLVAPFAKGRFSYADANCSTISSMAGLSGWERFECSEASEFGEQYALTKQGDQYAQAIGLLMPSLSAERRSVLQALLQTGPVIALLLDFNSNWWLYGQTRGLRLLKFQFKGGTFRGETSTGFTLEGTQDDAARAVNKTFINLIHNSGSTPTTPQDGVPATPAPTPFRGFAYLLPAKLGQF